MPTKRVATEADVQTTAGTVIPTDIADAGSWAATTRQVKKHTKLTIGGTEAIYEATCTFLFTGTKQGAPASKTEDVTLSAATTKLQAGHPVLRDGDTKQSTFGNTVKIASSRKLTSG